MSQAVDITNPIGDSYLWAAGCQAWVLNNSPAVTVKEELMAPGTREQLHLHKAAEQFFYILDGQAVLYLEGQPVQLKSGQGLRIPALATHYIANESTDQPVRFLVITSPGEPAAAPDNAGTNPQTNCATRPIKDREDIV